MKNKKSILFILIILVLIFMTGVSASELNNTAISSEDDMHIELAEIDNDSKAAQEDNQPIEQSNNEEIISEGDDGSFAALKSKIDNAPDNSIIKLENDYEQSGSATGNGIEIRKPITIDGQGKTIDAKGKIRFFYIKSNNVVLKNIVFINGFFGSTAGGAAIWSNGHNTIIYNCTFMNNYARDIAGALYLKGANSVVSNCSFFDNYARDNGGAIRLYGDNSVVSNCSFANNSAGGDGGAILLSGSNSVVSNCSFVNSSSENDGGAIYFSGKAGVVSNCSFVNSSSEKEGGTIYWYSKGGTVSDCSFVNSSSARNGGAVYWHDDKGSISNCSFVNSITTYSYGGAIYWHSDDGFVSNCSFMNSSSVKRGGAIYWDGDGFVSNCSFVNSISGNGSAVYWHHGDGSVSVCSFVNCSAGDSGAVYWHGLKGAVSVCSFVNCSAGNDGGAVYWYANSGDASDCSFVNCSAGNGGAVYWHGLRGNLFVCSFVNCSAGNDGGAVYWQGNNSNLFDCSFVNCSAGNDGGVIYLTGDKGTVSNCSFIYGSGIYGGTIYLNGTNSSIYTCIFVNNTADRGIIHFENVNEENISHFKINNNIFLNNAGGREITFNQIDNNSNADYNWFGNNANDYSKQPTALEEISDTWLFLKATVNPNTIRVFNSTEIFIKLYSYNSSSGNISEYDYGLLKPIDLSLATAKGNVNVTEVGLDESFKFTATNGGIGSVTATMENTVYIIEFNITKISSKLTADNLSMSYKDGSKLVVRLLDDNNNPISNALIYVNNTVVIYKYRTDDDGFANIPVNLKPNEYTYNIIYKGDADYNATNATRTVVVNKLKANIDATDYVVGYKDGSNFTATLTDDNGNAISGGTIKFDNGVNAYRYHTDENGVARAPIKLIPGTYTYVISFAGNGIYAQANITKTLTVEKGNPKLEASNATLEYKNGNITARLTDDFGNVIVGATVRFDNGINSYRYHTDENGVATAPVNLKPGQYNYTIRFEENSLYNQANTTASVKVNKADTVLTADNISMTFKDGTNYTARLADTNGNAIAGIIVKVNNTLATYKYKTDADGYIRVPINLKLGEYAFTAFIEGSDIYNPCNVTSTVVITR